MKQTRKEVDLDFKTRFARGAIFVDVGCLVDGRAASIAIFDL